VGTPGSAPAVSRAMKGSFAVACLFVLIASCTGMGETPSPTRPGSTGSSVESLQPASSEPELFFATKPEQDVLSMDALYQGPLVVRNGCVLIGSSGTYTVPIWPKGFTAARDRSGRLEVRDPQGAVMAVEGETFEMGGGYVAEFRPRGKVQARNDQLRRVEESLGYAIPERCLRRDVYGVWSVGET
jgi:hypothetical protein